MMGGVALTINSMVILSPLAPALLMVATSRVVVAGMRERDGDARTRPARQPGTDGVNRLGGGGGNNYMMDGVVVMDPGNGGPAMQVNTETIAEVKVLTSSYQAEYGRASGLQITAVTKTGTNRFRGSLYDVERNSDWNANSRTNILNGDPKTVLRQREWGYSIGGPVGRPGGNNKLFFFYTQEF